MDSTEDTGLRVKLSMDMIKTGLIHKGRVKTTEALKESKDLSREVKV